MIKSFCILISDIKSKTQKFREHQVELKNNKKFKIYIESHHFLRKLKIKEKNPERNQRKRELSYRGTKIRNHTCKKGKE